MWSAFNHSAIFIASSQNEMLYPSPFKRSIFILIAGTKFYLHDDTDRILILVRGLSLNRDCGASSNNGSSSLYSSSSLYFGSSLYLNSLLCPLVHQFIMTHCFTAQRSLSRTTITANEQRYLHNVSAATASSGGESRPRSGASLLYFDSPLYPTPRLSDR